MEEIYKRMPFPVAASSSASASSSGAAKPRPSWMSPSGDPSARPPPPSPPRTAPAENASAKDAPPQSAPLEICEEDPTLADRHSAARHEALHAGADADDSSSDESSVQQTGQSSGSGYTYDTSLVYRPLQPQVLDRRRVTGAGHTYGRMQPPTRETAAARARVRLQRQAIGGLHLPGRMAKMVAGASASDLVPQERPLTIMHGDLDATADIMKSIQEGTLDEGETGASARKLGKRAMQSDVAVPEYVQHFTGKSSWEPPPMEIDVEEEEAPWRREWARKAAISRFSSERERLVDSFKRYRGDERTEVEQEELDHRLSEDEDEESDELHELRQELHRNQLLRREQQARKAAEAAAAAEAARLAAEAEDEAAGEALLEALGSSSEDEAPASKPASSDEETDVEDRHYPDPVPAFLLDRKSSYVKISANKKRKFGVNRKLDVGRPAPGDRWWLKLTSNASSVAAAAAAAAEPDEDDEVMIDLAPPDEGECVVY